MRVLILTASIGEGHERPARILAEGLREECPDIEVEVVDFLDVVGAFARRIVLEGSRFDSEWGNRLYDLEYRLIAEIRGTRRLAGAMIAGLAGRPAHRAVREAAPEVVVSTYPVATEALGRLRARGRLNVPVVATITDLAALRYWAHPAINLHLITHPEAAAEVRRLAPGTPVKWVRGLSHPTFYEQRDQCEARSHLGMPLNRPLITVSGGGWGVGDLIGAAEESLLIEGANVVCLAGHSEAVRDQLVRRFELEPRVTVLGFTERMRDLLSASDVLVHSTAGGTVLEAIMVGCPVVSYGWGRGHVRVNNEAYMREGLAEVAGNRNELGRALCKCIAIGRGSKLAAFRALPTAASEVLGVARPSPLSRQFVAFSYPPVLIGRFRDQVGNGRGAPEEHHAGHEKDNGSNDGSSSERGAAPVLATDERGEDHWNSDLHDEDRRRHAGGGATLQGARFRDHAEDDYAGHERRPGAGGTPEPVGGVLGNQLADERREGVGSAGANDE